MASARPSSTSTARPSWPYSRISPDRRPTSSGYGLRCSSGARRGDRRPRTSSFTGAVGEKELRQLDQEVQDPGELGRAEVVVADQGYAGQAGPADDGHALVVVQQRVGLGFPGRSAKGGAGDQVRHQLLAHHVLGGRL